MERTRIFRGEVVRCFSGGGHEDTLTNRVAMRRIVMIVTAALLVCGSVVSAAPSPAELVKQGNSALERKEFDKALEAYREAELAKPDAPELAFNQGVAHYRQRDFAKARELFGKALATRDLALEAKAKFNLGNCKYSEALEKMSNLQEAIDNLRGAIEYYVDALEIDPQDRDARANIETAQLLIKDLLDKLKNQQEQNPSSQPGQDQNQQNQEQQDQQQQQEGQQEQNQQDQERTGQENQNQEEQQQEQQGQEGQEEQQPQEQEGQQGEAKEERQLTEEEAQRLLQAVRDKERERRDERARRMRGIRPKVARDW